MPHRPRVVIHPGLIMSATDGDMHYITGYTLRKLYGLQGYPNVVILSESTRMAFQPMSDDIHLHPRYEGDYTRPKETL